MIDSTARAVDGLRPDDVAAGRGQRDQGDVVLILAPGALTLAVEYAHDPERDVLDPDALADRIGVTEQLSGHRPAEHDDLGSGIALVLRDRAARDDVPLLNREELRRHRVEHRDPVLVASDQPDPAGREWGRGVDEGKLTLEGPGILFGYRRKRSRADARSAHGRGPGPDEHQIGAHAADLLHHALASPRPHRQHGDHRRHADDHPERRQGGTQLVGAQRAEDDAGIGQRAIYPRSAAARCVPCPGRRTSGRRGNCWPFRARSRSGGPGQGCSRTYVSGWSAARRSPTFTTKPTSTPGGTKPTARRPRPLGRRRTCSAG